MLSRGRKDIAVLKREVDFRDSVTQTGSDDLFTCKVVRKLGKGTDGVVFLVTCPDSSLKESALKLIPKKRLPKDKEDEVDPFAMNREVQLLQRLNHPHIIEYKASFQTTLSFGLLNEYCEYGTLETWRKNTQFLRSEPEVRILFLQLLSAVHHLHSQKVYHLDIFIQNILLTSNSAKTGLILKLADFGWAFDYGFDWTRERKEDFYQEMDLKQLSWLLPELCPNDSSDSRSLPLASLFQSVNVRFDLDLPLLQIADYVNHDWVLESTPFPSVIPLSALQEKPNFSNIDDEQSTLNRTTMLHAAGLLHLVGIPRW